jgi:putative transposase
MDNQEKERRIQELDRWIDSNPDSRELKRALAVKLALQNWSYRGISEALNVSKSFISKWKRRFFEDGIEGLKLSYKGGKSYLDPQEKQEVFAWLQQKESWDLSELEEYIVEQYNVVFRSPTSYYSLFKEAQSNWQKYHKKSVKNQK